MPHLRPDQIVTVTNLPTQQTFNRAEANHASVSNDPRSAPVFRNDGLRFCDNSLGVTLKKSCDGRRRKLGLARQTSIKPVRKAVI